MRDTRPSQPTNLDILPRLTLTRNSRFICFLISADTMCLRFWVNKRGRPPNSQGGRPQTLAVTLHARAVGTAKTSELSMKRQLKNANPGDLLPGVLLNNVKNSRQRFCIVQPQNFHRFRINNHPKIRRARWSCRLHMDQCC